MSTQTTIPEKPQTTTPKAGEAQEDLVSKADPKYPLLLYNQQTRAMKAATDKESEEKLKGQGFGEDPLPPLDPDSLTPDDVKQLQELLAKAAKALAKLGELSQEHAEQKAETSKKAPNSPPAHGAKN